MDTPISQPAAPVPAPAAAPTVKPKRERTDIALAVLGLAGIAVMAYLTKVHYATDGGSSLCNFGAGFSCETVNKSLYAEVLGFPLSLMGMAYFAAVSVLAWLRPFPLYRRAIQMFTIFSLVFGLQLTFIEVYEIGSICVFCEVSKGIMLAIFGLATVAEQRAKRAAPWGWFVGALGFGIVFALVTRYIQTNFY